MPWEKTYDEAKVLEAAMRTFWSNGYRGTSMADLVAATGLNRGSLYAGFGNKRTIFLRALGHYDEKYRTGYLDRLGRDHDPREAILLAFETAAQGDPRMPGGCLMVNSAMELAPHDPEIAALVEACMAHVEAFFAECLLRCTADGPPRADSADTAKVLQGLMVALLVMTRANRQSASVPAILAQVRRLVG